FDAGNGAPLWSKALEAPIILGQNQIFDPGCADMGSGAATYEVGVTSTPVIDPAAGLLYGVDKTTAKHVLHALSLTTEHVPSTPPAVCSPTGFTANIQLNRPGLLFLNGVVYIAFGSHCDAGSCHGWVLGHDAKTPAL